MIKYIGIILVSASCSLLGAILSLRIKKGAQQRAEILELFYEIKNGIEYMGQNLCDIYSRFFSKSLYECGFLDILKTENPQSLLDAFDCENLLIGNKELSICREFASKIGKSTFIQSEKKLCERYTCLFENLDKKLKEEEKTKCQLYSKLGLLLGLATAVIFM